MTEREGDRGMRGNIGEDLCAATDEGRPFDARAEASLEVLGTAIAMLNTRIDGIDRRLDSLERALFMLAKTLGVSPVWSTDIDAAASGGVKH
jgi:hypothetical protein